MDCLVVGLPDARFGEIVTAAVSLVPSEGTRTDSQRADEVMADVKSWLSSFKLPRKIRVVPHVQRAANGKADYTWAKETLSQE